ncbi:MAG TPA: type III pantothenate kinase [Ignavibacteriaceae bacterium]|nr:type III pantothenate kinase [Ignavibacteriaceae bacterium]
MLLTLDIGNTNIKSALFDDQSLKEFIVHSDSDKVVEFLNKTTFTEAAICSVNPRVEKLLTDIISEKGIKLFRAGIQNKFNLKINYETPETLGMDRVCSATGALEIATKEKLLSKNQYLVTIDLGTATTINIVSPSGEFIGGLIAPGIATMLKSLNEKTAQLPLPDLNNYKGLIGDSTDSSIISGVITSTIGMIGETINQLSAASDQIIPMIFATGGNARFILPHLKYKVLFEEALVLKGLKVIYDLNK